MSTRPAAGGGTPTGRGGLGSYLRDRPIWVKLGLIMIVPTIATVFIGFSALLTNISGASSASRVQAVAALTQRIGGLSDALQSERASANTVLGDTNGTPDARADEAKHYQSLFAATDQALSAYRAQRAALSGLSSGFTNTLDSVEKGLADLNAIRDQATQQTAGKDTVVKRYESIIDGLLSVRQSSTLLAADSDVNQAMQTANAVSSYKEALAQERIKVDDLLFSGKPNVAQLSDIYTAIVQQRYSLVVFNNLAQGSDDSAYFTKATEDGTSTQLANIEQQVLAGIDPTAVMTVNRQNWDDLVDSHMVKLRTAEQHFDDQVAADARILHQNEQRSVLVEAGLLLGLVLIAVLIAWSVARSMNRALRDLRHGALAIAQYGLPQAVARLRDPSLNTALSPHQVAQQIADPLPVRSKDEFGQVTEAFNAVHLEAVRTAAEQAALRSSVATMFVNLARRSQILVDRLIGHLDRLERGEEDPDRLAELFQLDHLATRMRRNDENLLVLAGADSTRVQREPAALIDVLRAAQSEVEHYTRIEFGVIDRDIEIAAHAVNDLVHLVAELFDNATAFSPPDSTIVVEARRVGDRAVLYVEDHGIGISSDQLADLNERLSTPPMVDVAVSRMMGLVVVARLAVRHGVKVELRPALERGTIADVLLPTAVLVPRALAGRSPLAGLPAGRDEQPEDPRSGFAPLALESGPVSPAGGFGITGQGLSSFGSPFDPAAHAAPSTGRTLPSWSDLTGAGSPGGPDSPFPPHNGGDNYPPANGGTPLGGLPYRRPGENEPIPSGDDETGPARPNVPRQTPSSPEVSEASSRSAAWMAAAEAIDADPVEAPVSPSAQYPSTLYPGAPGSTPSAYPAPPAAAMPTSAPPAPALPSWPPPGPMRSAPVEEEQVAPAVPERVVAALDITSEIPRVRAEDMMRESDAVPAGYAPPAVPEESTPEESTPEESTPESAAPAQAPRYPDETMELPIFRELESAWFRTSFDFEFGSPSTAAADSTEPATRPAPAPVATASTPEPVLAADAQDEWAAPADNRRPATPREPARVSVEAPAEVVGAGRGQRAPRPPAASERTALPDRVPAPEAIWRTAADQGWLAAEAAAEPVVDVTTEAGLPRRTPMAQLVPGGIEKPNAGVQKRSPEQVRGLLSAYHRGVQRGRTDGGGPTSGNPPHSGKEQEA